MHPTGPPRNSWLVNDRRVNLVRARAKARPVDLPARPQEIVLDLSRTALVVVDMQNDFCSPQGWLASIGVDVAPTHRAITCLSQLLPSVRASQVPVVWLNWGNRPDQANIPPNVAHVYNPDGKGTGLGQPLASTGSPVLQKGSWSAQVVDELELGESDIWVDKYRMSGFFDTELDSVLRNLDVTTVLFGGVNVDQCVMATLTDAACLGYDCVLLEDCCATTSPPYCEAATIYNVVQCFGFVALGAELMQAMSPSWDVAQAVR